MLHSLWRYVTIFFNEYSSSKGCVIMLITSQNFCVLMYIRLDPFAYGLMYTIL